MRLIFVYGMPGTGKLTVGRELAARTGYKLFHNHLAVDLLTSVFEFGSAPFVELREEIWLSVFEQAGRSGLAGLIFTFAPEATVRPGFPAVAQRTVAECGGEVEFVDLVCPVEELRQRLGSESRRSYGKLTSVALFDELRASGSFEAMTMPAARITIDTSRITPAEAATEIVRTLNLDSGLDLESGPA